MAFKLGLRLTNRRVRLVVGALLLGMVCIQFAERAVEAGKRSSDLVQVTNGQVQGSNSSEVLAEVDRLAHTDHIALLEMCLKNYQGRFSDYKCVLVKQERLNGVLGERQTMRVKFIDKPFSVAMQWVENPPLADRLIYVEGKYNNMMLARPANPLIRRYLPTAVRKPDDAEAMKNTLRPVNQFGFERSLKNLLDVYRQAKQAGDLPEGSTAFGGYCELAGRKAVILIRYLPAKDQYPAHKTLTYIDLQYLLPICVEGYDWEDRLSCRYEYKEVEFNVGLRSEDFLPEANEMKAPS